MDDFHSCRKNSINHKDYFQLRFKFEHEGEMLECFATAPSFMQPTRYLVTLQQVGLEGDVMLDADDIDPSLADKCLDEALRKWIVEMSLHNHDVS